MIDGMIKKCIENFIENSTDFENCNSIKDAVDRAVDAAYSDAKRTMKGIGDNKELKEKALNRISKGIQNYLEGDAADNSDVFDEVHSGLCKEWIDVFKDKPEMGMYGKAQKIVNMAFKYMYCYYYNNRKEMGNWKDWFKYCHMPLDSYTLAFLPRDYSGETVINSETKWSTLDFQEYVKLCENARAYVKELFDENVSVLEAEFILWDCSIIYEEINIIKKHLKNMRIDAVI